MKKTTREKSAVSRRGKWEKPYKIRMRLYFLFKFCGLIKLLGVLQKSIKQASQESYASDWRPALLNIPTFFIRIIVRFLLPSLIFRLTRFRRPRQQFSFAAASTIPPSPSLYIIYITKKTIYIYTTSFLANFDHHLHLLQLLNAFASLFLYFS